MEVKNLSVSYGTVEALKDISLSVEEGEIVALIGPNGAGKSTALKAVCGLLEEYDGGIGSGEVLYKGKVINNLPSYDLVKEGLSLVPEGRHVFPTMTVRENLEMGGYIGTDKVELNDAMERAFNLFPKLRERQRQKAGTLSSGEQQMLAIGRALMLEPELLLLDEPSLGLSPNFVEEVFERLKEINREGRTILLVEQNARMALEYSHRAYVFKISEIAFAGKSADLIEKPEVKKTFLGEL